MRVPLGGGGRRRRQQGRAERRNNDSGARKPFAASFCALAHTAKSPSSLQANLCAAAVFYVNVANAVASFSSHEHNVAVAPSD